MRKCTEMPVAKVSAGNQQVRMSVATGNNVDGHLGNDVSAGETLFHDCFGAIQALARRQAVWHVSDHLPGTD